MRSERPELDTVGLPQDFKDAVDRLTDTEAQPGSLGDALVGFDRTMLAEDVTVTVEDMYQAERPNAPSPSTSESTAFRAC